MRRVIVAVAIVCFVGCGEESPATPASVPAALEERTPPDAGQDAATAEVPSDVSVAPPPELRGLDDGAFASGTPEDAYRLVIDGAAIYLDGPRGRVLLLEPAHLTQR